MSYEIDYHSEQLAVEYSYQRAEWNIGILKDILKRNHQRFVNREANDWQILALCNSEEDANKFIEKIKLEEISTR